MTISIYILIGVLFMFTLEKLLRTKSIKKHMSPEVLKDFGIWEILVGIVLWPVWLLVFLYNFFKQLFR